MESFSNMQNKLLLICAFISFLTVPFVYDVFGFMQELHWTYLALIIGIPTGWVAMKNTKPIKLKIFLGIPVGLNSIVALYFLGSAALYFAEVS